MWLMYENETGGIQPKERGNVSAYKRGGALWFKGSLSQAKIDESFANYTS